MAAKRALITGITGQDGSYLAELLLEKGYEVHGMVRRSSTEKFERIEHLRRPTSSCTQGDLLDQRSLVDALRELRAGRGLQPRRDVVRRVLLDRSPCSPPSSPASASRGCSRRMREVGPEARFYQASSCEMFGKVLRDAADARRRRSTRARPTAWRRSTATSSPSTTASRYDLFAASGILFNHESQRRGLEFVTRKITHARGRASSSACTTSCALGNLDAERDWGYASDYVEAMWLMLQQDEPDDYVIATGETHSVRELRRGRLRPRRARRRTSTCASTRASCGPPRSTTWSATRPRRSEKLGWEPQTSFEELIRLMVDSDLELLGRGVPQKQAG